MDRGREGGREGEKKERKEGPQTLALDAASEDALNAWPWWAWPSRPPSSQQGWAIFVLPGQKLPPQAHEAFWKLETGPFPAFPNFREARFSPSLSLHACPVLTCIQNGLRGNSWEGKGGWGQPGLVALPNPWEPPAAHP
ncbi:hypothetical protein L345_14823, partial [Ophiophagus hannah]